MGTTGVVVVIAEIVFLVGEDDHPLNNDVTLIFWWNHNVINNVAS